MDMSERKYAMDDDGEFVTEPFDELVMYDMDSYFTAGCRRLELIDKLYPTGHEQYETWVESAKEDTLIFPAIGDYFVGDVFMITADKKCFTWQGSRNFNTGDFISILDIRAERKFGEVEIRCLLGAKNCLGFWVKEKDIPTFIERYKLNYIGHCLRDLQDMNNKRELFDDIYSIVRCNYLYRVALSYRHELNDYQIIEAENMEVEYEH